MAVEENLVYFLKTGRLKNINFGITKDQLTELLGEPKDISRNSFADIYRYQDFEFYILKEKWKNTKRERFFCLLTYTLETFSEQGSFVFNTYNWTNKLTIEEAILFLDNHEIGFNERNEFDEEDVRSIYTEGDVFIQFRDWKEVGKFTLYKFGRKVELNPIKPPTKQVSFEIEETFYNKLKEKAEKTRISIANLCREIIEKDLENNN